MRSIGLGFSALCLLFLTAPQPATGVGGTPEGMPRLDTEIVSLAIDVQFDEPTSIRRIYRAIGNQAGLDVTFAPQLSDLEITVDLEGLDVYAALERTSRAAGHFWQAIDPTGILVILC